MVIASGAIDDRRPFGPLSETSSSFFSEDLIPTKRQVGFWKSESTIDHKGSKSVLASPLEKIHPMVVNPAGGLEHPGGQAVKGQLDMLNLSNLVGRERREDNTSNLHSVSWGDVLSSSRSRLGMSAAFLEPTGANEHMHDYGFGPSTCKLRLIANGAPGQSVGEESSGCSADEPLGSMREVEAKTIGDLLPDDLISGIMDGFEHTGFPNHDDVDEDIFCTGGGMELEDDSKYGDRYQDAATHQLKNSLPRTIGKASYKSLDNSTFHDLYSPARLQFNKSLHDFSMSDPQKLSSPIRIESTHQQNNQAALGEPRRSLGHTNIGQGLQAFHLHSLPEYQDGICNISKSMPISARNGSFRLIESGHHNNYNTNSSGLHGHSSNQNEALGFTGVGSCPLHGQDYIWNNSNGFLQSPPAPVLWSNFQHPVHMHGYSAVPPHMLNTCTHPMDHHLGSTPNNVGSFGNMHTFQPRSLENLRISGSPQQYPSDFCVFGPTIGNYGETMFSPVSAGFTSLHQLFHATNGRNPMSRVSTSYDATNDRIRSRRHDGNVVQSENKKQFELDIDHITKGEDLRTTLMIKNIPNKYNCKLLLAAIDENHRGTYDFIYLPIDFKNKCNVGYAFINMTDPQHIIPFYKTFNGKKWDKFNSEKVASLAYARIQGRDALISHFQNSSLMNEEKWCRPILFHKDGPNAGDQEPFPVGNNIRSRSGRNRSSASSDTRGGTPPTSPN